MAKAIQALVFEMLALPQSQEAVAQVMPPFIELRAKLSPESVGGAHLVGTRGVVVIAHGSSSRFAMDNAIEIAAEGVDNGLVASIASGIAAEH